MYFLSYLFPNKKIHGGKQPLRLWVTRSGLKTLFILFIEDRDVKRQLWIALKKLLFWTTDSNSAHSEVFQTVILKILTDISQCTLH